MTVSDRPPAPARPRRASRRPDPTGSVGAPPALTSRPVTSRTMVSNRSARPRSMAASSPARAAAPAGSAPTPARRGQRRNRAQQCVLGDRDHSSAASAHHLQHGIADGRAHHRDPVGDRGSGIELRRPGCGTEPGPHQRLAAFSLRPDQARLPLREATAGRVRRSPCRAPPGRAVADRRDHHVWDPAAELFPDLEGHRLLRLDRDRIGAGVAVEPAERAGGGPRQVDSGGVTFGHLEDPCTGLRHQCELLRLAVGGHEDDGPHPRSRGTDGGRHSGVAGGGGRDRAHPAPQPVFDHECRGTVLVGRSRATGLVLDPQARRTQVCRRAGADNSGVPADGHRVPHRTVGNRQQLPVSPHGERAEVPAVNAGP